LIRESAALALGCSLLRTTSAREPPSVDVPTVAASVVNVVHCTHPPMASTVGTESTNASLFNVVNMVTSFGF